MKEKFTTFLTNQPAENIILSSLLVNICSQPVKLDVLDGTFKSTTSPFDTTHERLTLLHMIMFEVPLTTDKVDAFSLISTLKAVNTQIDEFMHNPRFTQLVRMAQECGNLHNMTIPKLQNTWLISCFDLHKKQIFNVVIFKELLKSMVSCLAAKQLIADMLASYESACIEDTSLEAAMTVFQRKKLNYDKHQRLN